MKKLIQGIVEFHNNISDEYRALFATLALGQKPDALFIACSDSRVVPNLFASTNPGDLFVVRSVGNLIPPSAGKCDDASTLAALEFSVLELGVRNIIVCGHSECGAINMLCAPEKDARFPHLNAWLKYGKESVNRFKSNVALDATLAPHNQVSQINVLQQMDHIKSHPFVREKMNTGTLRIHGWWFDIAQANVYCYEEEFNKFILIDNNEAQRIAQKMA